jgi:hypothetical protein
MVNWSRIFICWLSAIVFVSCGQNENQGGSGLDSLPDAFSSPIKGQGDFWLKDSARNLIDGFVMSEGYEVDFGHVQDESQYQASCFDGEDRLSAGFKNYIEQQLDLDTSAFFTTFSDQNIYRSHIFLKKRKVGVSKAIGYFSLGKKEVLHFNCKVDFDVVLSDTNGLKVIRSRISSLLTQVFKFAEKQLFKRHLVHITYLGIQFKGKVGNQSIDTEKFWELHEFRYEQINSKTLESFIGITNKFIEATKIYFETMMDWEAYIESYNERDDLYSRTLAPLRAATDIARYLEIKELIKAVKELLQFSLNTRPPDEELESYMGLMFGVERTDRLEVSWELERMRKRYAPRAPQGSSLEILLGFMEEDRKVLMLENLNKLRNQLQTGDTAASLPLRQFPTSSIDIFFYHQILPQKIDLINDLLNSLSN